MVQYLPQVPEVSTVDLQSVYKDTVPSHEEELPWRKISKLFHVAKSRRGSQLLIIYLLFQVTLTCVCGFLFFFFFRCHGIFCFLY